MSEVPLYQQRHPLESAPLSAVYWVAIRHLGGARWSTNLSPKVLLPHAINFGALRGASLVTQHPGIEGGRNPRTPPCGLAHLSLLHPGGNSGENLKSISHRCHLILVAFVWELTEETIDLPLACL